MAFGVREAERGPAGQRGEGGGRLWAAEGQALSVPHGGELELQLLLGVEGPLRAYLLKGETGEQGGAGSLRHRLLRGTSSLKRVTTVTVVKNCTKF